MDGADSRVSSIAVTTKEAAHVVCEAAGLPPGSSVITSVGRISIGVFNVNGNLFAVRNICPHRGAQLCLGIVGGTMVPSKPGDFIYGREDEVLTCPWHRWEFDVRTGRSLIEPERTRVKTYRVGVENGDVVIYTGVDGRALGIDD
jgi:3-phenylpropionate/trans-cinnamate dioxygenase ferredoxin subunit